MSKVDLDEAKKLMAEAAAWKPDESAIMDSVMSATFLLMGAEQYIRQMADELALARAVVEAAASSGNFEDYIFEGRRPERPGDARLYDALAAYRAKVGGDETSLVRHTDERCITDGRCYCRPRGKGGV